MVNESYSVTYLTDKSPTEVFTLLVNVRGWWSGIYGETIEGSSEKVGDEFTFKAGDGVHYSRQKLVELVPVSKITWEVTESRLTFVEQESEWTGTKICFEISQQGNKSVVKFTHLGLVPEIQCYGDCSKGWRQYLDNFLGWEITPA